DRHPGLALESGHHSTPATISKPATQDRSGRTAVPADTRPVLYVVACGAYPAGQLPEFVRDAQVQGWNVCVIATPDGVKFLDTGNLSGLTGHPGSSRYKRPDEPDVLPSPDALVVAPATFNTVNKWAQGISDTLALGLLNEAVGLGLPMIVVPWPNAALAAHPAFVRSLGALRDWGVTLLFDPNRLPTATGQPRGRGPTSPASVPWGELRGPPPRPAPAPRHTAGRLNSARAPPSASCQDSPGNLTRVMP